MPAGNNRPFKGFANGIDDPFRGDGFSNLPPVMNSTGEESLDSSTNSTNGPSRVGRLGNLTFGIEDLEGPHPRPWHGLPTQSDLTSSAFSTSNEFNKQLDPALTAGDRGLYAKLELPTPPGAYAEEPLNLHANDHSGRRLHADQQLEAASHYYSGQPASNQPAPISNNAYHASPGIDHDYKLSATHHGSNDYGSVGFQGNEQVTVRRSHRGAPYMIPSTPVHVEVHTSDIRADGRFVGTPHNNVPSTDTPSADRSSPITAVADTSRSLIFLTANSFTYPLTLEGQDAFSFYDIDTQDHPTVVATTTRAISRILPDRPPMIATTSRGVTPGPPAAATKQASKPPRRGGGPWTDKEIRHVQRLRATHLDSDVIPNWTLIYQEYQKTYGHLGRSKHSLRKKLGQVDKAAQQTGTSSRTQRKWGMVVPKAESDAEEEEEDEDEEEAEEGWDGLWEE